MLRIQRYLLSQFIGVFAAILLLIVTILLFERLLRIADIVSRSPNSANEALWMVVNLIPHYMAIGIPAAFFLGVLVTVRRLSLSGEIVSIWGYGKSLFMISRPFMYFSVLLSLVLLIITGFLQPHTRYNYRSLVNSVVQTSLTTVFQEGKFIQTGDLHIWTGNVERDTGALGPTIILRRQQTGEEQLIFAREGKLLRENGDANRVELTTGSGFSIGSDDSVEGRFQFESAVWAPQSLAPSFRERGIDERELVLTELWGEYVSGDAERSERAYATIHDQIGRSVLIILFPLIAIPFGLSYGRNPPSNAVLIGLLFLIAVQKSMDFAKSAAMGGELSPWIGTWGVVGVVALFGLAIYGRSALTQAEPPLAALPKINFRFWRVGRSGA